MKTKLLLVFVSVLAAVGAGRAADASKASGSVNVTFVAPEKFTDVKSDTMDSDKDREWVLSELKSCMVSTAQRLLAPGQTLEVRVTDVDLAGDFEPWRGGQFDHIRFMKDIYPPRMDLEFRLVDAQGKVLNEGKRHLQNLAYLMTLALPTSDSLRYDKDLINGWLRLEFRPAS